MSCFYPMNAWRSRYRSESGKYPITWDIKEAWTDRPVVLPCGKCIDCRLRYARDWAVRITHEASRYEYNWFLTLTYDDLHLPRTGTLEYSHVPQFIKDLRAQLNYETGHTGLKTFGVGEYGEKFGRPHYHVCLINAPIFDAVFVGNHNGYPQYMSATIAEKWGKGRHLLGSLTFESAGYCARYVTKKLGGQDKDKLYEKLTADQESVWLKKYEKIDSRTGEVFDIAEEKLVSVSRRPGIGSQWIEKFVSDLERNDWMLKWKRADKCFDIGIPKYYVKQIEKMFPEKFALLKKHRDDLIYEMKKKDPEDLYKKHEAWKYNLTQRFQQLRRNLEL